MDYFGLVILGGFFVGLWLGLLLRFVVNVIAWIKLGDLAYANNKERYNKLVGFGIGCLAFLGFSMQVKLGKLIEIVVQDTITHFPQLHGQFAILVCVFCVTTFLSYWFDSEVCRF